MSLKDFLARIIEKYNLEQINERIRSFDPVFTYLGAKIINIKQGEAEIEFPFKETLQRRGGFLNGGIIMTAIDFAGGYAAMTVNDGIDQVTQELKINFLEPLYKGPFRAIGRVLRKGKHTIVAEIKVYDAENKLGAVAIGTWFILRNNINIKS
jgi:uncharacterized protein (TIGR00369 family)